MLRGARPRPVPRALLAVVLVQLLSIAEASARQPQPVTIALTPTPTPAAGQAGNHLINLFASGLPSGVIDPLDVTILLTPVVAGPAGRTAALTVTTLAGGARRITFLIPSDLVVSAPAPYRVTVAGVADDGTPFQSGNASTVTVTPGPALLGASPNGVPQGAAGLVTIGGQYTNFVRGVTTATFGPGIAVGGAAVGGFGPVEVLGPTRAVAQITVDPNAAPGPRRVQVRTGAQAPGRDGAFSVAAGPTIAALEPSTLTLGGWGGTGMLTVRIANPSPTSPARVVLTSSNPAVVSSASEIVIPAGEATAEIELTGGLAGATVTFTATLNRSAAIAELTATDLPAPLVLSRSLSAGSPVVGGSGVALAIVVVSVNDVVAGTGTIDAKGAFGVVMPRPLLAGEIVTATQSVNGARSLPSAPVWVQPLPQQRPAVATPVVAGSTLVRGFGGVPTATVDVFADGALIGQATVPVDDTFAAVVPPLVAGQQVWAVQTLAGQTSEPSLQERVVDVVPAPTLRGPLIERVTTLTGTGMHDATVEAFIDGVSVGTGPVDTATRTWIVVVPAGLVIGQRVTARQTVAGRPSALSPQSTVREAIPPPFVGALLAGATRVSGAGLGNWFVEVFVDGAFAGGGYVGSSSIWNADLQAPLVGGQKVRARQRTGVAIGPLSAEVTVVAEVPRAPTVTGPLVAGMTTVTGTGPAGTTIRLEANFVAIGTTTVAESGTWVVVLGQPLSTGQRIAARAVVHGISSPESVPVIVMSAPPPP